MVIKNKRKKVDVKINKVKKPFEGAIEIDLKSAIEPEETASAAASDRQDKKRGFILSSSRRAKKNLSQSSSAKRDDGGQSGRGERRQGPRLNIYRKIAYSFIILTVALLAVIFYFSFVKVTIAIVPARERLGDNLIIDIYDKDRHETSAPGAVLGAVERVQITKTKSYTATGLEVIGEETTGKVTIINNYGKNQPLVATTRLLSPDSKLFRLKNTVNVPAGGTVEGEVYADEPGRDMAIGPTKFTIPGLWAGLQDKIYAESAEPMEYRQKARKSVTQSDIDAGLRDLRRTLLAAAEEKVGARYGNYRQAVHKIDENSLNIDIDGKVGEEREEFSITMTAAVAVAAFNDEEILKMARDKLSSVIAGEKKLKKFTKDDIAYGLGAHDMDQGTAVVNVSFGAEIAPRSAEDIIDREKIFGLTREQLNDFLDNEPKIESYEVSFSPAFIDKVPSLADRIKIRIKN